MMSSSSSSWSWQASATSSNLCYKFLDAKAASGLHSDRSWLSVERNTSLVHVRVVVVGNFLTDLLQVPGSLGLEFRRHARLIEILGELVGDALAIMQVPEGVVQGDRCLECDRVVPPPSRDHQSVARPQHHHVWLRLGKLWMPPLAGEEDIDRAARGYEVEGALHSSTGVLVEAATSDILRREHHEQPATLDLGVPLVRSIVVAMQSTDRSRAANSNLEESRQKLQPIHFENCCKDLHPPLGEVLQASRHKVPPVSVKQRSGAADKRSPTMKSQPRVCDAVLGLASGVRLLQDPDIIKVLCCRSLNSQPIDCARTRVTFKDWGTSSEVPTVRSMVLSPEVRRPLHCFRRLGTAEQERSLQKNRVPPPRVGLARTRQQQGANEPGPAPASACKSCDILHSPHSHSHPPILAARATEVHR
mmetsp:Transcript_63572/g.207340  ORF Transcript_63572/g.207340 Transcript_63572/m.207340 type:complete len:418 (-) Transcript_63572:296-1549(-)